MSKSVTKYISLATLGLLAASVTPQLASAATTQSYGTQGEVTFTAGTDTTGPVDPQDPTVSVKPTEPDGVNPVGPTMPDSGLTIVYASCILLHTVDHTRYTCEMLCLIIISLVFAKYFQQSNAPCRKEQISTQDNKQNSKKEMKQ